MNVVILVNFRFSYFYPWEDSFCYKTLKIDVKSYVLEIVLFPPESLLFRNELIIIIEKLSGVLVNYC